MTRLDFPKTRIALAAATLAAGAGFTAPALAKVPAGGEFRVNTFTTGSQLTPAIALDADGDFVVVWQSTGQDPGGSTGVYAQRYNAAGVPQGGEFRVNTYTTGHQGGPDIAMDADGDFVITWRGFGQPGDSYDIYAQRYSAAGVAQGSEFLVNTYTTGYQDGPAIAMDADGDFVVSWLSRGGQDTSGLGVYAQRFNAAGVPQGGEFQVNSFTTGDQKNPAIAMDADGDFVVSWHSDGQDSSGEGIYAQRYNASGVAQGGEFQVNTFTTNNQRFAAIAMDSDGDFVVSWFSFEQDGSGNGIYAQRYNAAGLAQGSEFQVNTFTTSNQVRPAIAMDSDGDFVVSWEAGGADGDSSGTAAQRYNAAGVAQGGEIQVNTFTTSAQSVPAVGIDADGDFVVSWESFVQDPDGSRGIYAQRFQALTLTPNLTVTTSAAATNTTPVAGGPAGTYSFNAQFCNNVAQTMTGLSSKTLTLTNSNNLLNRSRDAFAAPGASAIPPGGAGTEKDLTATGGYADLALAPSECVAVPYQIGLTNRDKFNFTVRIRGDNGL